MARTFIGSVVASLLISHLSAVHAASCPTSTFNLQATNLNITSINNKYGVLNPTDAWDGLGFTASDAASASVFTLHSNCTLSGPGNEYAADEPNPPASSAGVEFFIPDAVTETGYVDLTCTVSQDRTLTCQNGVLKEFYICEHSLTQDLGYAPQGQIPAGCSTLDVMAVPLVE